MQNKPNLLERKIDAKRVFTKDYEDLLLSKSPKNKPNSNPNKANCRKVKVNASICYAKVYENETAFRRRENKPNLTRRHCP